MTARPQAARTSGVAVSRIYAGGKGFTLLAGKQQCFLDAQYVEVMTLDDLTARVRRSIDTLEALAWAG